MKPGRAIQMLEKTALSYGAAGALGAGTGAVIGGLTAKKDPETGKRQGALGRAVKGALVGAGTGLAAKGMHGLGERSGLKRGLEKGIQLGEQQGSIKGYQAARKAYAPRLAPK